MCKREALIEAVNFFAAKFNMQKTYNALFELNIDKPTLVKYLVHDMFMNQFSHTDCTSEEKAHYDIVYGYLKELNENGFVK